MDLFIVIFCKIQNKFIETTMKIIYDPLNSFQQKI